jgi:hypothetical protein
MDDGRRWKNVDCTGLSPTLTVGFTPRRKALLSVDFCDKCEDWSPFTVAYRLEILFWV